MLFSCNKWASWRTSIANTLIECALNYDFVREWQRDWFYLWFVDYLGVSSSSFISFQSWRLWTFTNYHWWPLVTLRSPICAATYKANQSRCFFLFLQSQKLLLICISSISFLFPYALRMGSVRNAFELKLLKQIDEQGEKWPFRMQST